MLSHKGTNMGLDKSWFEEIEEVHMQDTENKSMAENKQKVIEDELFNLQRLTNKDGTVDAKILDYDKKESRRGGDKAIVELELPYLDTELVEMPYPKKDSETYKFVRIIRHCGYQLEGVEEIKGHYIKYHPEKEEIIVPYTSVFKRIKAIYANISLEKFSTAYYIVSAAYVFFTIMTVSVYTDSNSVITGIVALTIVLSGFCILMLSILNMIHAVESSI